MSTHLQRYSGRNNLQEEYPRVVPQQLKHNAPLSHILRIKAPVLTSSSSLEPAWGRSRGGCLCLSSLESGLFRQLHIIGGAGIL